MQPSGQVEEGWPRIRRIPEHDGQPPRTIRADAVMGTAIRVEVIGEVQDELLDEVFAWFREVDQRFSMFRTDSEMNRLAHGELHLDDVHAHVRQVLRMCDDVRAASAGVFDIRRHRPDGLIDPTALVKGWSVDHAGLILTADGVLDWSINAGGDVLVHGRPTPGEPWRVGIQHPRRPDAAAAILQVTDAAVATSGAYERGEHVTDARGLTAPGALLSATVVGPELGLADAYSTAAFAMGADAARWLAQLPGYEGLVITDDRRVIWTEGLRGLLDRPREVWPGAVRATGGQPGAGTSQGMARVSRVASDIEETAPIHEAG